MYQRFHWVARPPTCTMLSEVSCALSPALIVWYSEMEAFFHSYGDPAYKVDQRTREMCERWSERKVSKETRDT